MNDHKKEETMLPDWMCSGETYVPSKDKEAFLLHDWCRTSQLLVVENANHVFGAKEPWEEKELPKDLGMVINHTMDFINNN